MKKQQQRSTGRGRTSAAPPSERSKRTTPARPRAHEGEAPRAGSARPKATGRPVHSGAGRSNAGRSNAGRTDTPESGTMRPVGRKSAHPEREQEGRPVRSGARSGAVRSNAGRTDTPESGTMRPVGRKSAHPEREQEGRPQRRAVRPKAARTTTAVPDEPRERRSTGGTPARRSTGKAQRGADTAAHEDEGMVRLNKFLADAGITSRRKADELIREGVVRINKETVSEPGTKVHPSDLVTVNGEPVSTEKRLTYILLNKPKGYITTTSDEKGRKTVMDIVHSRYRVFPVGRLDRNTTGVLLFTNDGELANRLMHPRYEVSRLYSVTLDKSLQMDHAKQVAAGVELEDGKTNACSVVIDPKKKNKVLLEITEGRNREVRRIFESLGYEVDRLDRKMYANLSTRGMKRGEFRHLTRQEVRELEELLGIRNRSSSTGQASSVRRAGGGRKGGRASSRRRS